MITARQIFKLADEIAKKFSPQKSGPSKNAVYECGLESEGDAYRFAVSPRISGRGPELEDPATLEWIGRFVGQCADPRIRLGAE